MSYKVDDIICEPASVYHEKSSEFLSSHQLSDFRKSPLLYYRKKLGLVESYTSTAYLVGSAVHTLILEGKSQFLKEYTTDKLSLNNVKDDWSIDCNKTFLTEAQITSVYNMRESVKNHRIAAELLSNGIPEGVVRTYYYGLPCQIRMDWFSSERGIIDLKTCRDLDQFTEDSRRYSYGNQLAFYRAVMLQVINQSVPVYLIAVEKQEPFRCGVWLIPSATLDLRERENEDSIKQLKKCLKNNIWVDQYSELKVYSD